MECSVCSILHAFGVIIGNVFTAAMQYPILAFIISVFVGFIIIMNIHTAHMICNYNQNPTNNQLQPNVSATTTAATSSPSKTLAASTSRAVVRATTNFDYGLERGESTLLCHSTPIISYPSIRTGAFHYHLYYLVYFAWFIIFYSYFIFLKKVLIPGIQLTIINRLLTLSMNECRSFLLENY